MHARQTPSCRVTTPALNFLTVFFSFLLLDKLPLNDCLVSRCCLELNIALPRYSMYDLCHAEYTRKMIPFIIRAPCLFLKPKIQGVSSFEKHTELLIDIVITHKLQIFKNGLLSNHFLHPALVDTSVLFSLDLSARPGGWYCYTSSLIWLTMVYFGSIWD